MEKIWFTFIDGTVAGPFSTDEVLSKSKAAPRWADTTMIWWKGHSEWVAFSYWHTHLPEVMKSFNSKVSVENWYVFDSKNQYGPLDRKDLIRYLNGHADIGGLRIWTEKLGAWKTVFEVDDVLRQIGVHPRQHIRTGIIGHAHIQTGTFAQNYNLYSISEGGFGITEAHELSVGQKVHLTLRSPLLVAPIRSIAHVVFDSSRGKLGLSFEGLNMENRSIILDYIRQQKPSNDFRDDEVESTVVPEMFAIQHADREVDLPAPAQWFVNRMGLEQGPLSTDELMTLLTNLQDKSIVRVSDSDAKDWKGAFDFKEVVEALGLNRRQQARAPIMGELVVKQNSRSYFFEIFSISAGGLGLKGEIPYRPGEVFEAELKSPVFPSTQKMRVEFIYHKDQTINCLRFRELPVGVQNIFKNYIQMFHKKVGTPDEIQLKQAS